MRYWKDPLRLNNPVATGQVLGAAVRDADEPYAKVQVIFKGDLRDMPNLALDEQVLGNGVTAWKLNEIPAELLPEWAT